MDFQPLTFAEMCERYPNEWLLLLDPVSDATKVKSGVVLVHHPDKRTFYQLATETRQNFVNQGNKGHSYETAYAAENIPPPPYRPWLHTTIIRENEATI